MAVATYPKPNAHQVATRIVAQDAISSAGIATLLSGHPAITMAGQDQQADVLVFASDQVTFEDIRRLRSLRDTSRAVVLLAGNVTEASLLTLIECGVVAIVDRGSVTGGQLAEVILDASQEHGVIPKEILGRLLGLVRTMQQETLGSLGFNGAGLTEREVQVLRMLADGAETSEIAQRLTYSESTIKHVLHTLTTRFKFRNRVHAVASAVRAGIL